MTEQRLVQVGVADPAGAATPINADVTVLGSDVAVAVTLSVDYEMLDPIGYPFRASFTGSSTAQYPQTISSGSTIKVLQCEANALIDAGAGSLA